MPNNFLEQRFASLRIKSSWLNVKINDHKESHHSMIFFTILNQILVTEFSSLFVNVPFMEHFIKNTILGLSFPLL